MDQAQVDQSFDHIDLDELTDDQLDTIVGGDGVMMFGIPPIVC